MGILIIIVSIVVVLVIALGLLIYFLSKRTSSANGGQDEQTSAQAPYAKGDRIQYQIAVKGIPGVCAGSTTQDTVLIFKGDVVDVSGNNVYVQFDTITTPVVSSPAVSACKDGITWVSTGKTADWLKSWMGTPTTPPTAFAKYISFPLQITDGRLSKI